jgi:ubiquinone/menaquinone biosynthesis C-methylase UbiE
MSRRQQEADRPQVAPPSDTEGRYAYWERANLHLFQSRERALLELLRRQLLLPLTGRKVLDLGCGSGMVLQDMVRYGARPRDLWGIDLAPSRIKAAQERLPAAQIEAGDGQNLLYDDDTFDLVLAFTLFSSVIDDAARRRIAAEIERVTRPGGVLLIYDFWINPLNRRTRPLRRSHVGKLFPGRYVEFASVTLAPPITRMLVKWPGGWVASSSLEMIPFLKSHFLAAVRF